MLKTPPLQTATATIDTLCARLQSATLLEDRRASILGLRSFAKQYPASVASGSVRELIATLRRDGLGETSDGERRDGNSGGGNEDVDTIRLVMETLLMLFTPDADSPEAGDEISFFMADEFSVRQDNILLLLSLLDPVSPFADYYSRKYAIDILTAICAARPDRLRECILSVPLGVSRLAGVLDDARDAVRNAGLLLLIDLTNGASEELRKILAFEDVFSKVFALISMEGGLAEAGIIAQDCLSLLANLVKGSASNQTMFRESGCVAHITQLLLQAFPSRTAEAPFITQSREKSSFGLLQLLRFFLVPGESSTPQNQAAFFRAGTAQILIDIGFSHTIAAPIRTASLIGAADMIANNAPLQEAFASFTVFVSNPDLPTEEPGTQINGTRSSTPGPRCSAEKASSDKPRTYIIEALLGLVMEHSHEESLLRAAGCGLIQAYLVKHDRIRAHFLQRAITGHVQHEQAANVLSALTRSDGDVPSVIFASWIIQYLIVDDFNAKSDLAAVKEGNADEGEDVLSFIQFLGSKLQQALQQPEEIGTIASYASLLTIFLWSFSQGVDDFLAESSGLLQSLANLPKSTNTHPLVAGLSTVLLGTTYEFSTKDSPIPRRTLAPVLTQTLTRSKYLDALLSLRTEPTIRDFDLVQQENGENLLCQTYVDFFSVEYSRLRKVIDKDPGLEVLPPSAMAAGVDRDILDDLRQQLQASKDALATTQSETTAANQKQEQELLAVQKELQTATAEITRLRRINEAMQQSHESELEKISKQHERERQDANAHHQQALITAQQEVQHQVRTAITRTETTFGERIKEFERRIAELGNVHRVEQSSHHKTRREHEELSAKHSELSAREKALKDQHTTLTQQHAKLERDSQMLQTSFTQLQAVSVTAQKDLEVRTADLDRLNLKLNELQAELSSKEAELAAERAGFADLEKELETSNNQLAKSKKASTAVDDQTSSRVAQLENQLREATEEKQSAKEELESMLLVMGDIEAKRDAYRAQVVKLGGEVTEDEDDDEEEDNDGEGKDSSADDDVD